MSLNIKDSLKKYKGKIYHSYAIIESHREGKKMKHKYIMNVSHWTQSQRDAFVAGVRGKKLFSLDNVSCKSGKKIGALSVFYQLAEQLGVIHSMPNKSKVFPALLLIIGRILTQGSRRHLMEWSKLQELKMVFGKEEFSLDTLYMTLDYLSEKQSEIEEKLFIKADKADKLFLYDVTSTYLEGQKNELAEYGYNRDKKRGKKQIVAGLLTNSEGMPVSIEAFKGNSQDLKTVSNQIKKLVERFGAKKITLVGDRGMLKQPQIDELISENFGYITAITKPQIKVLLNEKVIQLGLFDEDVSEVEHSGIRYILRRNPIRVNQLLKTREHKIEKINNQSAELSDYLTKHPRAKVEVSKAKLKRLIERSKLNDCVEILVDGRKLFVHLNQSRLDEESQLYGCYVIKTNVSKEELSKEEVHQRYKDLSFVERAFRLLKTGCLEIRPVFVRLDKRTRGHIFATMLSYLLLREFWNRTKHLGMTLEHMIEVLDSVQTSILQLEGSQSVKVIPEVSEEVQIILSALGMTLPLQKRRTGRCSTENKTS